MAGRSQQGTEEPGGVATRKVRSINFLGLPYLGFTAGGRGLRELFWSFSA